MSDPQGIGEFASADILYLPLAEVALVRAGARPSDEELGRGGRVPYFNGGAKASGSVTSSNTTGNTITIPSRGSVGLVSFQREPFWCGPLCYRIESSTPALRTDFLYYALWRLQPTIVALQQTGSIPALNKKELNRVLVPVPPLAVQSKIVGILDSFSRLINELEAELEARRQQYNHYRDRLLLLNAPQARLGDVIQLSFGSRITKASHRGSAFPVYGGGGESFRTDAFNREDEWVVSRFAMSANCVRRVEGRFWLLDSGFTFNVDPEVTDKAYIGQVLLSMQPVIYETASQAAQKNIDIEGFKNLQLLLPPLDEQKRIASKLAAFDSLVNDLAIGLPAELAARRKQYEYYRDRLLTFDELPT